MTYCNDDVIKLVFVIFVFDEVDDMVNGWYSLLNEAIDANAPLKRKRIRHDTTAEMVVTCDPKADEKT